MERAQKLAKNQPPAYNRKIPQRSTESTTLNIIYSSILQQLWQRNSPDSNTVPK